MRTIVDIPEEQLTALDAWAQAQEISRAEAVRRAVEGLLKRVAQPRGSGFGIYKRLHGGTVPADKTTDAILKELRAEWPE